MSELSCKRCGNRYFRLTSRTRAGEIVITHVCADCGFEQSDVLLDHVKERLCTRVIGSY
jgi:ribosomal protein L37E